MTTLTATCKHPGEHQLPSVPPLDPRTSDGLQLIEAAALLWAHLARAATLMEAPDAWAQSWAWLIDEDFDRPQLFLEVSGDSEGAAFLASLGKRGERPAQVVVGAFRLATRSRCCTVCGGHFVSFSRPSRPRWFVAK